MAGFRPIALVTEHFSWRYAKRFVSLGAPMMATQFFYMAMGFLDTAMAGHYSAEDLAGVTLGSNILWPVFMLISGILLAITPITAQLVGARRTGEVGARLHQGLYATALLGAVGVVIVVTATSFFDAFPIDDRVIDIASGYLLAASWGLIPGLMYTTLRYGSEGLNHPVEPMLLVGTALVLNGFLNWGFIYGKWGLPELGGAGCGVATAIVMWFEAFGMLALTRLRYFRAAGFWQKLRRPASATMRDIVRIGLPIGIGSFASMGFYTVISFAIGTIGVIPLAAHSVATNIAWATYVIPIAIGSATTILVGNQVGANDLAGARSVVVTGLVISTIYAITISLLLLGFRHHVGMIYSSDAAVISATASLVIFIALYQFADANQGLLMGALRGYKDTNVAMTYPLIGYWLIALPVGCIMGFGWLGLPALGVRGFWIALPVGLTVIATLAAFRLYRTSRDERRILALAGL